jgi:hypothetical protein
MNLQQLLHKIESFAKQQKFVNSVTIGDVYENWNGDPDKKYGALNIDIPQLIVNSNMQQMQVYLYYADRLAHDHSNEYEIKTTAELVLNNIINYCAELGDIAEGWIITFFTQRFADELAGGYVSFYVEIEKPIGDCLIDEYEEDLPTLLITENGEYDTTNYKKVIVNVPSVTTEEITQEEYDALTEYDPYKIYLITE